MRLAYPWAYVAIGRSSSSLYLTPAPGFCKVVYCTIKRIMPAVLERELSIETVVYM